MIAFGLLAVGILTANQPFDNNESQVHGENGWYIPHGDGVFYWMDNNITERNIDFTNITEDIEMLTSPITFHLYTRINPTFGNIISSNVDSIENSNFNGNKPTYIIIHGWTQSYQTNTLRSVALSALRTFDCNVIMVDWPRARSWDYASSVAAVPIAGRQIAKMIDFLKTNFQMSLRDLVVTGHSLGAHVAGFAGKNIQNGKLSKIIAMDAALPLYSYDIPQTRLSSTDAEYVQVIHTDAGLLGFERPIGHGDFYPNGGNNQPGCNNEIQGFCSHDHSVIYYAEALQFDNFGSIACGNYQEAVSKHCGDDLSAIRMGAVLPGEEASGVYYVPLRNNSPYGILDSTDAAYKQCNCSEVV
ncbi:phospholipase A1-like [Musca vetustissima]|uniref:phospholipase A1-like n=1 Tax=Musca vetustissima TaxID=27455 RepID=UPI002AB78553|nr:phospholipase A1-like [Musca vetustissima]